MQHCKQALKHVMGMARAQVALAEQHAAQLSRMQDDLPTAAYGDVTREWTHLPLTQARQARS